MRKSILVALLLSALGCNSTTTTTTKGASSGGGSPGAGGTTATATAGGAGGATCVSGPGGTTVNCPALLACAQTNCVAEGQQCYGAGFTSGKAAGGDCAALIGCYQKCTCGDTACTLACASKLTDACQTCSIAYSACQQAHCATELDACTAQVTGGSGGTGGSGATGAGGGAVVVVGEKDAGGDAAVIKPPGMGTGMSDCAASAADSACNTCLKASCCDSGVACYTDQGCVDLGACVDACADDACVQACGAQFPDAIDLYNAFIDCGTTSCSGACL